MRFVWKKPFRPLEKYPENMRREHAARFSKVTAKDLRNFIFQEKLRLLRLFDTLRRPLK